MKVKYYVNIKKLAMKNFNTEMTVKELIEEFCSRPNYLPSTRVIKRQLFRRHLEIYYDMKVISFSKRQVKEIVDKIENHIVWYSKSPYNQMTKWSILKSLSALFNYAEHMGYMPTNPFAGLKYKPVKKAVRHLSVAEVNALIASDFKNMEFKTAIFLALFAGLRRSEALGLKWEDIDLERRTITVRRNYIWSYGVGYFQPTKNKSERTVPINNTLYTLLKEKKRIDEMVVHISPSYLTTEFPAYAQKIGLHRYTFHDLRRTFGSSMLRNGVDLKTVSLLLGHTDIIVTSDYYIGIVDETARKAVETLDNNELLE